MPAYRFSGAKLRAIRERAGVSRAQVAQSIDRSESLVTLWELDYQPPPAAKLVELAAIFDVHVEDLFVRAAKVRAS